MKLAVDQEHRHFFRKHQYIEFDELLTADQCASLNEESAAVLSNFLKIPKDKVFFAPPEKLYQSGRDLWRQDPSLRKIVCQSAWAEIASELLEKKPLKIGFDQYFCGIKKKISYGEENPFFKVLSQASTLMDISSLQGIVGGLFLCLEEGENQKKEQKPPFPLKQGNGIFFSAAYPLDFQQLYDLPEYKYLLIVYADSSAVYAPNQNDLHLYDWKKLGYQFGDKLTEKLNPTLIR